MFFSEPPPLDAIVTHAHCGAMRNVVRRRDAEHVSSEMSVRHAVLRTGFVALTLTFGVIVAQAAERRERVEHRSLPAGTLLALDRAQGRNSDGPVAFTKHSFLLTGRDVYTMKTWDQITRSTEEFSVDASGREVDIRSAHALEDQTYFARFGKFDGPLGLTMEADTAGSGSYTVLVEPPASVLPEPAARPTRFDDESAVLSWERQSEADIGRMKDCFEKWADQMQAVLVRLPGVTSRSLKVERFENLACVCVHLPHSAIRALKNHPLTRSIRLVSGYQVEPQYNLADAATEQSLTVPNGHISVGRDNGGPAATSGIYSTSAYINPLSGQELPHVTAPVPSSISILDAPGTPINGGTSTASALTSGLVASAMSYFATYRYWPEAVRAALMASADDVEAGCPWPSPSWPVDAKSGCGRTNGDWVGRISRTPTGSPWVVGDGFVVTGSGGGTFTVNYQIQATQERKTRFVLSWTSDPDLGMENIDMTLLRSDGTPVTGSWGPADPVQVIEQGRLPVGLYTVQLVCHGTIKPSISYALAVCAKPLP